MIKGPNSSCVAISIHGKYTLKNAIVFLNKKIWGHKVFIVKQKLLIWKPFLRQNVLVYSNHSL